MERYQCQFHGLGSTVLLTIVSDQGRTYAQQLFDNLTVRVQAFEKKFSRFLPDSELTKFNYRAGEKTPVTPDFSNILVSSKHYSKISCGLFNPFILPSLQRAGYKGSWPNPQNSRASQDYSDRQFAEANELIIGSSWAQIPKSTALDFGGIGKGYLLDELAELLVKEKLPGYWLSLGGDIVCMGHDLDHQAWQVAIQNALNPNLNIESVSNHRGKPLAIATSGITKRRGVNNNQAWHHIIDPRTNKPAKSLILTATVTTKLAVAADVFAKCIVIAGESEAKRYKKDKLINSFLLQKVTGQGKIKVIRE